MLAQRQLGLGVGLFFDVLGMVKDELIIYSFTFFFRNIAIIHLFCSVLVIAVDTDLQSLAGAKIISLHSLLFSPVRSNTIWYGPHHLLVLVMLSH
jgi:hypothetical protein